MHYFQHYINEKAECLQNESIVFNTIANTGNFELVSNVLNVTDFFREDAAKKVLGDKFFKNKAFMTFAACDSTLQLAVPPQDHKYAKGESLVFAREIMRQTIVAVTNAIIPDDDNADDSTLSKEEKALRKYKAYNVRETHVGSLIRCATRQMGALIMDNLQQFREAMDMGILLEKAAAVRTNPDTNRLIVEAAMPHLEKIVPADVMQLADFYPNAAASPPEAIEADIATANEVMQKIYHGIKNKMFVVLKAVPAASVAPAAAAAAVPNPSKESSATKGGCNII